MKTNGRSSRTGRIKYVQNTFSIFGSNEAWEKILYILFSRLKDGGKETNCSLTTAKS